MCSAPKTREPLISVILPVYNGEALIRRAVRNVLNQTYSNLELIVVDDGSTDQTLKRLATFQDSRLKIFTQENQGVAVARNTGFSYAQGEYIAFLDADDLWFPEKLQTELAVMLAEADPVGIVYSGYYAVDHHEQLVNWSPIYLYKGKIDDEVFQHEGMMLPSTVLIHRQVMEKIGGFPLDCYHEDRVFFIRACQQFPAYPTGERLVVYRQTTDGRCRRVLQNYDQAVQAELSIVTSLQPVLAPEQISQLKQIQIRNLTYRFLMYNCLGSAKRLIKSHSLSLPLDGKKGMLAKISLRLGFNLMYVARVVVQTLNRYFLLPWWQWKRQPVYHL